MFMLRMDRYSRRAKHSSYVSPPAYLYELHILQLITGTLLYTYILKGVVLSTLSIIAGLRWHLDCFRCNTCNTLLDSDANLLLLGDGSLVCNNCTYSCDSCGNKIEDLAILTGDQSFCATCFRCRNCKRKIENLRYAKTSQGIFCMSCHESLMARRRKKSKAAAQAKARDKDSAAIKDKSLPALPPNAVPPNAFSSDRVTPDSETATELSPRPRAAYTMDDVASRSTSRTAQSPENAGSDPRDATSLVPPAQSYRNNRTSSIFSGDATAGGDGDSFFIPVALDPTPAATVTPRSIAESTNKAKDRDYFSVVPKSEKRSDSQASTPHIAFQEKGRTPVVPDYHESPPQPERPTRRLSKRNDSRSNGLGKGSAASTDDKKAYSGNTPTLAEEFKLQDAPKSKRLTNNARSDSQSTSSTDNNSGRPVPDAQGRNEDVTLHLTTPFAEKPGAVSRTSSDDRPSLDSGHSARGDSVGTKTIARKELPTSASARNAPTTLPRPPPPEQKLSDTYMQPRAPPHPPAHSQSQSVSSATEPATPKISPKLPRWSAGGDFSMDEDMARILGTDEGSTSILRRVSNAVRHGRNNSTESSTNHHVRIGHTRSVSETTRMTASPRWPKTPIMENSVDNSHAHDISSPISLSGATHEDPAFLKRQLRNSEQRVAELERQFNTEKDLKTLNKKLIEKRKTVTVLDTQTEIMIRQLEVLAGYVERAKETKQPIDPRDLEDSAIKEFVQKLDKVKQSMSSSIEELVAKREELMEEKNQMIADRDRARLEFEQLVSKNAQLADLNNDLTHQIQERFKSQIGGEMKSPNGLGIYSHNKGVSTASVNLDSASLQTAQTLIGTELDESQVLEGPTVVNIRKGQVRKFNWKKGGSKVAHNITKGLNRAAVAIQGEEKPRSQTQQGLSGDQIGVPYNMTVTQTETPTTIAPNVSQNRAAPSENSGKGFGFFGGKSKPVKGMTAPNNVSTPAVAEAPTTLFGSDLVERADHERRQIPSVVTRCIEEVELRGMDVEGIYRKTGGNSQVKMVQEGFEKMEDFDISDPSIDITAVTSVLKQYFRKLPNPLLTFEVYERILESNGM